MLFNYKIGKKIDKITLLNKKKNQLSKKSTVKKNL